MLAFEDVDGQHPMQPWQIDELDRVISAMEDLSLLLTPSPLPDATVKTAGDEIATHIQGWRKLNEEKPSRLDQVDDWSRRHIESLVAIEDTVAGALKGDTLLHCDIRADNILLAPGRTWFVDWPHARVGPPWLDVVCFAPSVIMQGGPPPEQVVSRHSACRSDADAITAAIVALAGYFTRKAVQPPPPGLPTVRAFQDAQGVVAREWVAQRTGLS